MANEEGLAGEFYTHHRAISFPCGTQQRGLCIAMDGSTPQDTQRHLCGVWAKARAAISRAGIQRIWVQGCRTSP